MRAASTLAFLCLMSGSALAQQMASAEPFPGLPSGQPVVDRCTEVSRDPAIADPNSGICVTAARAFVSDVQGLDAANVDAALADLVTILAELPRGTRQQCERYADEIAQAIIILSESSSTREQRGALIEVAQTIIDNCAAGQTASLHRALATPE